MKLTPDHMKPEIGQIAGQREGELNVAKRNADFDPIQVKRRQHPI